MVVLHRFGPICYEDPSEALSRLKQTTTVAAFEQLSHRVDGLHEPYLKSCFIAGLRDDIRLDIKIKQPRTSAKTIGVARLIEERNSLHKRGINHSPVPVVPPKQASAPLHSAGLLGPPPTQKVGHTSVTTSPPVRHITSSEERERREKGLCYYYDEKFILGHRCQLLQLFMIEDLPSPPT